MEHCTRVDRFVVGDYPPVCARSGLPADTWVPVQAGRRATWPWFFFPVSIVAWLVSWLLVDRERIWGRLPFATGHVGGIEATWDRHERVVLLRGVHPGFVAACKEHQRVR